MCDTKRDRPLAKNLMARPASCLRTRLSLAVLVVASAACTAPVKESEPCLQERSQALAVCAKSRSLLHGIDVSVWQGTVDWRAIQGAGVTFAFVRASDGLTRRDEQFAANWSGMRAQGVVRGVYQFFRPSADPIAQADLMIEMIAQAGGLAADDLPPVIDLEVDEGLAPEIIQARALQWITRVEQVLKRKPIVYSGANFAASIGDAFVDYPLWAPNYKATYENACPTINEAWTRWFFWQWTSTGSIAGVSGNVDRNVFDGSLDDLKTFIATTHLATPDADAGAPVDAGMPATDAGSLPPITPSDPSDAAVETDASTPAPDAGDDDKGGMGMGGAGATPPPSEGCTP